MTHIRTTAPVLVATLLTALSAGAQSREAPTPVARDWSHGSTVSVETGAAVDASTTGVFGGAALGWELKPKLMIEGSGRWANRDGDAAGFNAALKVRAGLRRSDVSPFVEAGIGLYHLSTTTLSDVPAFYGRRAGADTSARHTFTDPSFHLGAGVNMFVTRRLAIQPAVDTMLVTGNADSFATGWFAVRVVYHFEDHPVTPSR